MLALIGLTILYFLPSIICPSYKLAPVFVLNLFLGWTLVGWVAALVWAVNNDSRTA